MEEQLSTMHLKLSKLNELEDNLCFHWIDVEMKSQGIDLFKTRRLFNSRLDYSSCKETPVPCRPFTAVAPGPGGVYTDHLCGPEVGNIGGGVGETPTSIVVFKESGLGIYYIFSRRHCNIYPADVIKFVQSHCLQPSLLVGMHYKELPMQGLRLLF